jgi:hypothetical protein
MPLSDFGNLGNEFLQECSLGVGDFVQHIVGWGVGG